MTPSQLVFDLLRAPAWEETDFLVTSRNEQALQLVHAWPAWGTPAAIIFGPRRSGKTYLAKIWQHYSKAEIVDAASLAEHRWLHPFPPLAIEDIDTGEMAETALFHHLNLAREHASFILLTAETPPGQWRIALPDLKSRIRACPAVEIHSPDEEHLAALLVKHFSDRQIEVAPDVISYLTTRMERSMAAAQRVTAQIDKLALSEHRKITRAFAAKVLNELNAENKNDDRDEAEVV